MMSKDLIDRLMYALANRTRDNREVPELITHEPGYFAGKEQVEPDSNLAECVCKGVRHDAELLRKAERGARIDECERIFRCYAVAIMTTDTFSFHSYIARRIRELETEEA